MHPDHHHHHQLIDGRIEVQPCRSAGSQRWGQCHGVLASPVFWSRPRPSTVCVTVQSQHKVNAKPFQLLLCISIVSYIQLLAKKSDRKVIGQGFRRTKNHTLLTLPYSTPPPPQHVFVHDLDCANKNDNQPLHLHVVGNNQPRSTRHGMFSHG